MALNRDNSNTINDREEKIFSQKEGDIFFKHDEDPKCSHIAIRNEQIDMHVDEGNCGILIDKNTGIAIQAGNVTINATPLNFNIRQGALGTFTFNPLSFIPSTDFTPIPGFLWKPPAIALTNNILGLFKEAVEEIQQKNPANLAG